MSRALKAAFLSALVFPGIGHIFLKNHLKGASLAGAAIAFIYLMLSNTLIIADEVRVKIQTGEIPQEFTELKEAIFSQLAGRSTPEIEILTLLLLSCWLIGIVDSYRIGRAQKVIT